VIKSSFLRKNEEKVTKKKNGHRQYLTEIVVENVITSGYKPDNQKETATTEPQETKENKNGKKTAGKSANSQPDDLKKIEGVGPKIASILAEAGFETFAKLAKADPEKIREILLEKGGKRYAMQQSLYMAQTS